MARVYRKTDRVKVKITSGEDTVTLSLSPLSQHKKVTIQALLVKANTLKDSAKANEGVALALKYGIKDIQGLKDSDNKPYELQFENDELTDDCLDDLMNMQELSGKIMMVCTGMVNGVPKEFKDDQGNKIIDVEILGTESEKK